MHHQLPKYLTIIQICSHWGAPFRSKELERMLLFYCEIKELQTENDTFNKTRCLALATSKNEQGNAPNYYYPGERRVI